jgi:hypothetical protein
MDPNQTAETLNGCVLVKQLQLNGKTVVTIVDRNKQVKFRAHVAGMIEVTAEEGQIIPPYEGPPLPYTEDELKDRYFELAHKKLQESMDQCIDIAWGVIANAYGGNWDEASEDWRNAAERWRDTYLPETSRRNAAREQEKETIEQETERLYKDLPYNGVYPAEKPARVPGGNSIMQDQCRGKAAEGIYIKGVLKFFDENKKDPNARWVDLSDDEASKWKKRYEEEQESLSDACYSPAEQLQMFQEYEADKQLTENGLHTN